MIPALGLLVGLAAGLFLHPAVPLALQPYLPIAVIAALDAVFGGVPVSYTHLTLPTNREV